MYGHMRFGRAGVVEETLYRPLFDRLALTQLLPEFEIRQLLMLGSLRHALSDPDESDLALEAVIPQIDKPTYVRARGILDQLPWILTKSPTIVSKLRMDSLPGLSELEPNFRLVAGTLFQFEYRLGVFVQFAMAIWNGSAGAIFDQQLVAFIRSIRDIPSGEISRSEVMSRISRAFARS
jgi:hypothetical protein